MDVTKRFKSLEKSESEKYKRKSYKMRDYVRKRISKTACITGAEPNNVAHKIMKSNLITKDKIALVSTAYHRYFKYQLDSHTAIDVLESDYELIYPDENSQVKNQALYDKLFNERFSFLANFAVSTYIEDITSLLKAPDLDPYNDVDETTKNLLFIAKTYMGQTKAAVKEGKRDFEDYTLSLQKVVSDFANAIP